VAHKPSTVIMG